MKNIFLIALFLIFSKGFAQTYSYEFAYAYQFKALKSKDQITQATAILRASEDHTYFADNWRIKRSDVLSNANLSQPEKVKELSTLLTPNFSDEIIVSHDTVWHYTANYQIGYTEAIMKSSVWKILPEQSTHLNFTTQKAEINFGGRTWQAWFTADIPLDAGPYKFRGLPGLIVKLEDLKGEHRFELTQVKNIALPYAKPKFKNVPAEKYYDLLMLAKVNSSKEMLRNTTATRNGVPVSADDFINELVKELEDINHIEKQ